MRTLLWTAIVVVVAASAYFGRAWADDKEKRQSKPAPRTRIAIYNLTYVLKNYDKYTKFQEELKGIIQPFQEKDTKLRSQLDEVKKKAEEAEKAGKNEEKSELEFQAKKIQHRLEDNSESSKLKVGKRSEAVLKILWQDVYEVTREYAIAHGFDLVLQYNDATTPEDYLSGQNIARKLQTGALMPSYWTPDNDISKEIVAILNKK